MPVPNTTRAVPAAGEGPGSTSSERALNFGMNLLTAIFAAHPPARPEILNMCQTKLVGSSMAQSLPYLCVLGRLVRNHPGLVSGHMSHLKVGTEACQMPIFTADARLEECCKCALPR